MLDLGLSQSLIQVIEELGYTEFTPIQVQSVPVLLSGKDLVGQSKTGSGKTAAFSLPILEKLDLHDRNVQALVLCPTRELCAQVAREIRKLGRRHAGLQVQALSGGEPIYHQVAALEKGVHIVVGTPGRILDHLKRKNLDLSQITTVVLDEADRMLDMGFQDDMEVILGATNSDRQTVFFSATFPRTVESMSRKYQRDPVRVTIEETSEEAPDITQIFYEIHAETKTEALMQLLLQYKPESAIVFCNMKVTVDDLTQMLSEAGFSTTCIHGDLDQSERDRVMVKFRNQSVRILIATDVAARGIDVQDLDVVFNYDIPNPDIYLHRIGRTGRAGKKGFALTIGTNRMQPKLRDIEKFMGMRIERKKIIWGERGEIFRPEAGPEQAALMSTIRISAGRKDKMRAGDILGALTGEAGSFEASEIGKIEIQDRFSYVAVAKGIASAAADRLRKGTIKGLMCQIQLVR